MSIQERLRKKQAAADKAFEYAVNDDSIPIDAVEGFRQTFFGEAADLLDECRDALTPPEVWSQEEVDGMTAAYSAASKKHGHRESLFAACAWLLRYRGSALLEKL